MSNKPIQDELPEDIAGWTNSLESSENNYRSLAECRIPIDECPWSEEEHAEARIIVCLLDERGKRMEAMRDVLESMRDDWDCDSDAHKYNTSCRCCLASRVLKGKNPWAYGND